MKKFINDPKDYVSDSLSGIVAAHADELDFLDEDNKVIIRKQQKEKGKVGIVTGGGFGHLPLFLGYVGKGMLDACVVGNVFASPSFTQMYKAIKSCDYGAGVLCLYGNYGGDKMNFRQAMEDAEFDDIKCLEVIGNDDVASAKKDEADKRRGVAGIVYAYKCAGAAAEKGYNLEEVARIAKKAVDNVRTLGVALGPCIIPEVGKPSFAIADGEAELGMGIHGEKGIEIIKIPSANELSKIAIDKIIDDMPLKEGTHVSVMINGLGGTSLEELYILYNEVNKLLSKKMIKIVMPHVGEYATSMEMIGASISILQLDDELEDLLAYPANTPFYKNTYTGN